MKKTFSIAPQSITDPNQLYEKRILAKTSEARKYTIAFVGPFSYCWDLNIDNAIEFLNEGDNFPYNLHIGNSTCIGVNLTCIFGRNHNFKAVSVGGIETCFIAAGITKAVSPSTYVNKGSIVIQNDVWIGENCTIMAGVTIHNGAVIARNSHVVSDVPPYAIVGGNPARVIGYRFSDEIINKLQIIQWWNWRPEDIICNCNMFNEDVESFCNRFYEKAESDFLKILEEKQQIDDAYFAFVDYDEAYSSYPHIVEGFLNKFYNCQNKRLVLFVQTDCIDVQMDSVWYDDLMELVRGINNSDGIKCFVDLEAGDKEMAQSIFVNCSHYIISRCHNTVYFSCLADLLGIEVLSGTDSYVSLEKPHNISNKR